jgi:hypothetical protein
MRDNKHFTLLIDVRQIASADFYPQLISITAINVGIDGAYGGNAARRASVDLFGEACDGP